MPVVATPVIQPSSPTLTCDDQYRLFPRITKLNGTCIPTKKRAILAQQNALGNLELQLLNQDGNPINLTSCGFEPGGDGVIRFAFKESVSNSPDCITYEDGIVVDATVGKVQVTIPATCLSLPLVLDGDVGVYLSDPDDDGVLAFRNPFYIWVDRSLFTTQTEGLPGLPSLDDIRIFLRDNGPAENLLIRDFEYDLAEFCQGAVAAVRYWNESQPPIELFYNTSTFPLRNAWVDYIGGYVMQVASRRFLRNHLSYQAGGMAIDDQNKFKEYIQLGEKLMADFRELVKLKKAEINAMAAITSSGSPYQYYGWF